MNAAYVLISLATRYDTTPWEFGGPFLEALRQTHERLLPEFIGNCEPLRKPFMSIDACRDCWAPVSIIRSPQGRFEARSAFLWKRRKSTRSFGHVMHTSTNILGKMNSGQIIFRGDPDLEIDWLGLFQRWCQLVRPQFGQLHLFTAAEVRDDVDFKSPQDLFQRGPPGWAVEKQIPNLGWATFLGDELATEVDVVRLNAAGFAAQRIGVGYSLTVTDNLFDVSKDFCKFSGERVRLKGLFRRNLCQIMDEPVLAHSPQSSRRPT